MAYMEGTGNFLAYNREASWGTVAGTAFPKVRKLAGAGLQTERTQITTQEMNAERALTGIRLGTRKARVTVPMEVMYTGAEAAAVAAWAAYVAQSAGPFDDFMQSWMNIATTVAASAQSSTGISTMGAISNNIAAITTAVTITGDIGAASLGGWIKLAGSSIIANNGYYKVVAYTSAANFSVAVPTGFNITAGAMGTGVTFTPVAYMVPGTLARSVTFLESQTDNAGATTVAKMVTGAMCNTFSLRVAPDSIVTADFGFAGKLFFTGGDTTPAGAYTALVTSAAAQGLTITAPATFPVVNSTPAPLTANDTAAFLMIDNVSVAVITSLSIEGNNGLEDMLPVGSMAPYALGRNDSLVTGTMDLYMLDVSYWTKFQAETEVSISIVLLDQSGTITTRASCKGYAIDIPKAKITSTSENKEKTKVMQSISFSALQNASGTASGRATASIVLSRLV